MLKQDKHKKFNYRPRFSKGNVTDSNLDDVSEKDKFVSKWQRAQKINSNRGGLIKGISMRMLIIILVLLLISMYVLDLKFI